MTPLIDRLEKARLENELAYLFKKIDDELESEEEKKFVGRK